MPFPNKGENHYSGVQNEKLITQFLSSEDSEISNTIQLCYQENINFQHAGGTQRVDDCIITNSEGVYINGISYKNHKKSGTIDWIKTSKKNFIPNFSLLETNLKQWKESRKEIVNNKNLFRENEKELRAERDSIIFQHIQLFNNDMIKSIFQEIYNHYCDHIIITCDNGKKILYYKKCIENFQELVKFHDWEYYIEMGRGKNSAQIWRKKENHQSVNTNLRLRLVLNNGLNAFFGISAANNTSIPCIQIQQDNVDAMIETLENVIEEKVSINFLQSELQKVKKMFAREILDEYKNEDFNDEFLLFNNYINETYTFGKTSNKKLKELESNYLYINEMISKNN